MGFCLHLFIDHCYSDTSLKKDKLPKMNNGLGINFFRYLKEEDEQYWVQVFAKLPFDEVELSQKGALFGVVRLKKTDDWSEIDMEMTSWVDEFYNGVETDFNLADFYTKFKEKYLIVDCLWVWIIGDKQKRLLKGASFGESSLLIGREGKKIDLSKSLDSKKILSGELKSGDVITFGVGSLDLVDENVFESLDLCEAYGYFKVQVLEILEVLSDIPEQMKEMVKKVGDEKIDLDKPQVLASDKYVGKLGLWTKLKNLYVNRRAGILVTDESVKIKRKKLAFLMGIIFVGVLVFSLMLGGLKKKSELTRDRWTEFSEPIEKMVSGAIDIAKINPSGAKQMVEEAKQKFLSGKGVFDDSESINLLAKKIEDSWVVVSGETNAELREVVNLELIRAGIKAGKISYSGEGLFSVISTENGVVMSVVLNNKEMKVLAGKGAGLGWIDSVISKDKAYVLTKGGVFVAGDESNSLVFDTAVTDPLSLSVFGSNLYVLEKGNKEVFKYAVAESGFGERQRWLKDGQFISGVPLDMDIDVDVWVLEQGNLLERFRRGVKEPFTLTGLSADMVVDKVSVDPESDKIALLSTSKSAVVFCSKETGTCEKQLKNDKLSTAKDIVFGGQGVLYVLFEGYVGMLN